MMMNRALLLLLISFLFFSFFFSFNVHVCLSFKQDEEKEVLMNGNRDAAAFGYIKTSNEPSAHEFTSNILVNEQFIGTSGGQQRRTYLQQLRDRLHATNNNNNNNNKGVGSSSLLHIVDMEDNNLLENIDLEQHAHIFVDDEVVESSSSNSNSILNSNSNSIPLNSNSINNSKKEKLNTFSTSTDSTTTTSSTGDGSNSDENDELNDNKPSSSTTSTASSVQQKNVDNIINNNNDGSSSESKEVEVSINSKTSSSVTASIVFDPPFLDFEDRPLCTPIAKTFTISKKLNSNGQQDEEVVLQVSAVTTESLVFHPSIIKKENNKVTINVIFLPRILKRNEGTIIIHTNFGPFIYNVYGGGIENAYNAKPILAHKLPVGADYRKPIYLHNPHQNETLLVKEIYTSEDFLLLSLPDQTTSDKNYNKKNPLLSLWRIEPQQTKAIILLNFKATQPKKHTGFIHVNTNRGQFIIPVEFIVSKNGVHRVMDEIDFGTFISQNEKRTRDVVLLNSSPQPVVVSEAYLLSPDPQLKLDFTKNTILQEGTIVNVAKVTYFSQTPGEFTGKIIFRTNDTSVGKEINGVAGIAGGKIEVPYRARIIHGTLDYRMNNTAFYSGDEKEKVNEIVLMNSFDVPIKFTSADVYDKRFIVEDFTSGFILQPKEKKKVLSVRYIPTDVNLIYKTNLILHTNITRLYVPLYSYHGNLEHFPINSAKGILDVEKINSEINLGILGLSTRKTHYFTISNPNPVLIKIMNWRVTEMSNKKSSISISYVKSLTLEDDLSSLTSLKPSKTSETINAKYAEHKDSFMFAMLPNQKVVMKLEIYTPTTDEEQNGFIEFVSQYKSLFIPLKFMCMEGSLSFTNQITFEPSFPGKILKKNIYATNTFSRPITITEIKSNDIRFTPVITNHVVEANNKMNIGHIIFDSSKVPKEKNYMEDDVKGTVNFSKRLSSLSAEEFSKYRVRNTLFEELKKNGEINVLGAISIQTDISKQYVLNVSSILEYPKLSTSRIIDFKLTPVGTSSSQYLTVENPSDHPLSLHFMLGNASLAKFLQRIVDSITPGNNDEEDKSYTEFKLHKDGMHSAVIPPHRHASLGPIVFTPKKDSVQSVAYLYIRNNLTVFDIVKLNGVGGTAKLVFDDNGSDLTNLRFDIKESQLGTWDNYTNRFIQNNQSANNNNSEDKSSSSTNNKNELVFHKKFILINRGNMPITVQSSNIDGMGCFAYGVKLHKCGKFELQPGESTVYKISYKPDFTTAVVDLYLALETDQGRLSFPIRFTLPYNVLPYFYEIQPISTGQRLFRFIATFVVLTLALYIIFRACRELKTIDSADNDLPTSLSDFIKPSITLGQSFSLSFNSNNNESEKHCGTTPEKEELGIQPIQLNQSPPNNDKLVNSGGTNNGDDLESFKSDKTKKKDKKKNRNKTKQQSTTSTVTVDKVVKKSKSKVSNNATPNISNENVDVNDDSVTIAVSTTNTELSNENNNNNDSNTTINNNNGTAIHSNNNEGITTSSTVNVVNNNYVSKQQPKRKISEGVPKKKETKELPAIIKTYPSTTTVVEKKKKDEGFIFVPKPRVFGSIPNNQTATTTTNNEKPKFYAIRPVDTTPVFTSTSSNESMNSNSNNASPITINEAVSPISTSTTSVTSNDQFKKEMMKEEILNDLATVESIGELSPSDSSSTSNNHKSLLSELNVGSNVANNNHLISTLDINYESQRKFNEEQQQTSIVDEILQITESNSSTFSKDENDILLLRSASVSPPLPSNIIDQVGVIGNTVKKESNTFSHYPKQPGNQPYWYFGNNSNIVHNSGSLFNSPTQPFGFNDPLNSFQPMTNQYVPPVVNRLASTFQQRSNYPYFSLFDTGLYNNNGIRSDSLFSSGIGEQHQNFYGLTNPRSSASSPSGNSDSNSNGSNTDYYSSLFSYLPPVNEQQQDKQNKQ
ncbi:hypothetical protein ABK040_016132 [Willaertia magna]